MTRRRHRARTWAGWGVATLLSVAASAASAQAPTATQTAGSGGAAREGKGKQAEAPEAPWGDELFRFDLGAFISWYTAAAEVGTDGESNRQLISDFSLGLHGAASYRVWGPFSVGAYLQFEAGQRDAGRFTGRVEGDLARVESLTGGGFNEFWLGPLLRAQWRGLFVELGWGPLAIRHDSGRSDLTAGGRTDGAFAASPTTAWLVGLGAAVDLYGPLQAVVRINYRIRYYETRGGRDLDQGLGHGTQDVIPFVGVAWALDREPTP